MNKLLRCKRISVDCVKNTNKEEIENGAPEVYGFDFDVRQEDYDEMVNYVKCSLEELKVPYMNVKFGGLLMVDEKFIFTKKQVFDAISRSSNFLIEESKRVLLR